MPYRYEDTDYWVEQLLSVQKQMDAKPFITVEQARKIFRLRGKSAAHARLKELVRLGKAERVQMGGYCHYHIKDDKRTSRQFSVRAANDEDDK